MKQIAIIGPTASGKTSLAVQIAKQTHSCILSLDSLSLYSSIDIASAKPTMAERGGIMHFGIDVLSPDMTFDVTLYTGLYEQAYHHAAKTGQNLVIVGGTSFYLKTLIEGISDLPPISDETLHRTQDSLKDLQKTHRVLHKLDPAYLSNIAENDRYRIEKALMVYYETGMVPSAYFAAHPPQPILKEALALYEITLPRERLRERIMQRTDAMIEEGLIDEVCELEKTYSRRPRCMKAIGIKESLAYLDGIYTKVLLREKIVTNTARLAKRQCTFNRSQFGGQYRGSAEEIYRHITALF